MTQDHQPEITRIDALDSATSLTTTDLLVKVTRGGGPAALEKFTLAQLRAYLLPYSAYVALLTQTSTGAPTATVLNSAEGNYLGEITWARTSAGLYTGTRTGAFTAHKTAIFIQNVPVVSLGSAVWTDANTITITTVKQADGTAEDGDLTETSIEIRVYS